MNSIDFITAFGHIDQDIVHEAIEFAQAENAHIPSKEGMKTNINTPQYRHKRMRKTFLLAAVITVLFAAMCAGAYALNLFGLRDFLMSDSSCNETVMNGDQTADITYMSLAGTPGTPEYNASLEWLTWLKSYTDKQPTGWIDNSWEPADESMAASAAIYSCYDDNMVSKLKEICEKYELKLHTLHIAPQGIDDLYALAGTETFIVSESLVASPKYIFEDGSFAIEGDFAGKMYSFLRNNTGTLPSMQVNVWNADEYEEMSYTNRCGDIVCIAFNQAIETAHILYNGGNAYIDLCARVSSRAEAEALADCFNFSNAAAGVPCVMERINDAPSAVITDTAVTLSDFADSPEYKAIREMVAAIRAHDMPNGSYRGVFPMPDEWEDSAWMNVKAEELCAAYGLTAHTEKRVFYRTEYAEACQAAQVGSFIHDPTYNSSTGYGFSQMYLYEDGSFATDYPSFNYIRKGSLCTDSHYDGSFDLSAYEESWQYETTSGAIVCCAVGERQSPIVIYETPLAWVVVIGGQAGRDTPAYALEAVADLYDFTQLP